MTQELRQVITNRILTLLALIAMAPALLLVIDLPVRNYSIDILGAPLPLQFGVDTLLITLVPVLTIAGVDWVLREHPAVRRGDVVYLFPFWIAPGLGTLALCLLLTRISTWPLWIAALIVGVVVIGILINAEYGALSSDLAGYANSRLAVSGLTYVIAYVLFAVIYVQRERTVISATLMAVTTFLISIELLAPHRIGLGKAALNAALLAFLIAQATWAMNYWNISTWSAGVLLLTWLYVGVGVSQEFHEGQPARGVLVEYGVVTMVALVVVWLLAGSR
ncbi:MAG: hypothetical protein NTZ50_01110 [Chloroflexi bacterium]|nr:hypothetical protein [Chloroflexota bacterium]